MDEAQGLPSPVLEEIRLLLSLETSHEKLLQIVLVGQSELEEKLARPELRQLRQRVMIRCKIGPLNPVETRGYIHRRLQVAGAKVESVFMSDALDAVHSYSYGIPRVINVLCEHALINSYADQMRSVSPQIVKEVAREFQFDKIAPLGARLDLNKTRRIGTITTRSIPTAPVALTNRIEIANTSIAERFAAWGRMAIPVFSASSYPWRRWLDKSTAMLSSSIWYQAATWVVHWLRQPVRPVRARRRCEQGPPSNHLRRKIRFVRIQEDLRKRFVRFWHDMKARSQRSDLPAGDIAYVAPAQAEQVLLRGQKIFGELY